MRVATWNLWWRFGPWQARQPAIEATLADIVTSGGLTAVDAGSLKRARELESLGFLQRTLAAGEKVSWTGGFGVVA